MEKSLYKLKIMEISAEFRDKIAQVLIDNKINFGGTDKAYSKQFGIHHTAYSGIVKGKREGLLSPGKWIEIARILQIEQNETNWKIVKTEFYKEIEDVIHYCKNYKEKKMLVEKAGIGKTEAARNIVKTIKNAFYIDCSQAKKKIKFFRTLGKTIGVEYTGKYEDVKENIKYGLKYLETPVIVLDEFGDLEYATFLDIKELLNATDCGWFAMGANGLRQKIDRGINNEKIGFEEVFDRFSGEISSILPTGKDDYKNYMQHLLTQIATVNNHSNKETDKLVKMCLDKEGSIRKLRTLINIHS